MIELVERPDVNPVCPHCEKEITAVGFKELRSTFGRRFIYFCSNCKKSLGVSHRKGFWMG